jgi:S1-C subfamily serine protease
MRVPVSMCLLFVYALGASVSATDWSALAKTLAKSVVFIEHKTGSCTGFVINDAKKDEKDNDVDLVLTAAHCEGVGILADQATARIIAKNTDKDLLVLEVDDLDRPALRLAKDNPAVGDVVASFGFGFGLEKPMLRMAHISAETYIPYEGIGGPIFFTDATFVGGMSGGPVVNEAGEVVMMVQRGTGSVGIGVGAETIRSKVGRYFGKPKP